MKDKAQQENIFPVVASQCIVGRVRKLSRAITRIYDEELRPFGLRSSQANIMVVIGSMGEAHPGDICHALDLEKSALSRNLAVMRKNGWIRAEEDEAGGQIVTMTAKGRTLMSNAYPAWRRAQKRATTLLGKEGVDAILGVVNDNPELKLN